MSDLDQAVIDAAKKDFKSFEKTVGSVVNNKIKDNLNIYINHLEKNMFSKKDLNDE